MSTLTNTFSFHLSPYPAAFLSGWGVTRPGQGEGNGVTASPNARQQELQPGLWLLRRREEEEELAGSDENNYFQLNHRSGIKTAISLTFVSVK